MWFLNLLQNRLRQDYRMYKHSQDHIASIKIAYKWTHEWNEENE